MRIALIGNPNSGKTTLFNALTGKNEKTGNWSGVTTVKAAGKYVKDKSIEIIDLPGVYSFSSESKDEGEVVDFLKHGGFDRVINVVDSNNLERNLYLTCLIAGLNIPYVVALNFSDETKKNGIFIDEKALSQAFGTGFIKISAKKKTDLDGLILAVKTAKQSKMVKSFNGAGETYAAISEIVSKAVKRKAVEKKNFFSKADDIICGKFTGIPLFILVIAAVYFLSLKVGGFFSGYLESFFSVAENNSSAFFKGKGVPDAIVSLFSVAVLKGVGSVLSFLPQILVLFIILTMLEESGYMSRVSFILDKLFIKIGLGGKSVIPFVLSCGCAVTGISSTRTISDEAERKNTIILCPFMPCGAKTAVFGWFSYRFFGGSAIVPTAMYFIGILAAALVGTILNKGRKANDTVFEMPPLRLPSVYVVYRVVKDKTKEFIVKSGTVIFAVSISFWFMSHFGTAGYTANAENSFLFYIGNVLKYVFYPLGFSDWKASVALFSGLFAKEAVIETAELLSIDFSAVLPESYKLFSYMTFILLSPPCGAALSTAKRELADYKEFFFMIFVQVLTAFAFSSSIIFLGNVLLCRRLIFSAVLIIITISVAITMISSYKRCGGCRRCKVQCRNKRKRNTTL